MDARLPTGFCGKAYHYKDKIIGVCPTIGKEYFMIGHIKPSGSYRRMNSLPLCQTVEEAQAKLDEYARAKGLSEVRA